MSRPTWYTELENDSYGITIRKDKEIIKVHTGKQALEIFENKDLGRVMLLDDCIMLTERHEFTYHEMIAHPGLFAHPNPEQVLIIGGGDGGTLREVVKHPEVARVVLCEIDGEVVQYSRRYLPFVGCGFDSPRAEIRIADGVRYVREHPGRFDLIIVDSTDPVGISEGLFRAPFYASCRKALKDGGIFIQQAESPFFQFEAWQRIFQELKTVFHGVYPYCAAVPMYLTGLWTFAFASDAMDPWRRFDRGRALEMKGLRYYAPELQQQAFCLPLFAETAAAGISSR